jgi:hypothetical protein
MHLANHAWILSITVNNNDNYCQGLTGGSDVVRAVPQI